MFLFSIIRLTEKPISTLAIIAAVSYLPVLVYHPNSTLQKYDKYQYPPNNLEKICTPLTLFKR